MRLWLGVLVVVGLVGCGASAPQQVVVSYGEAIEADDPEAAYELLAPDLKARMSQEAFVSGWKERRKGLLAMSGELKAVENSAARVRAQVTYSEYDTLKMRLTAEGWKITGGVLDLYSQETPRRALISFVRAVEDRRYEGLMRFIPERYAAHMSPESLREDFERRRDEIDELTTELKASLDSPITQRGDDLAHMVYGGQRKMTFVLEGGLWKIEDID